MGLIRIEIHEKGRSGDIDEQYRCGHQRALAVHHLGFEDVAVSVEARGTVFYLPAFDVANRMVGGVRLNLRTADNRLPTEIHLADPKITARVSAALADKPHEIGGGWVEPRYCKSTLLGTLFLSAMCAARVRGCRIGFGSAHEKIAPVYERFGAIIDRDHAYPWPDERYRTFFGWHPIASVLDPGGPLAATAQPILEAFRRAEPHTCHINLPGAESGVERSVRHVS